MPDLKVSLNNYLEEITAYLKDNSLLIFAPKSSVTLLTTDTHQAKTHPSIFIEDSRLPLVKDIGGLSGPLLSVQQAQPVCGRESI